MFEIAILFLLGCLTGSLLVLYLVGKTHNDTPGTVGTLRIIQDEEDPYIFLELTENFDVLYNSNKVVLNVEKSDISQK